ncbi:hypothetical protein B0T17DRAFT_526498 [Bombardia bombarda]|uniref:Uncharacterized protein n=1 Tax=Bombardia bombarda TaxID=252184 RepID=A0AA40CA21_9PEZI|nr:hypothetical protein B0T17DRAFT_526498 [Bombardia bombarda]
MGLTTLPTLTRWVMAWSRCRFRRRSSVTLTFGSLARSQAGKQPSFLSDVTQPSVPVLSKWFQDGAGNLRINDLLSRDITGVLIWPRTPLSHGVFACDGY